VPWSDNGNFSGENLGPSVYSWNNNWGQGQFFDGGASGAVWPTVGIARGYGAYGNTQTKLYANILGVYGYLSRVPSTAANTQGTDLDIGGGEGTGTATGGGVYLDVTTAGTSGSTPNYANVARMFGCPASATYCGAQNAPLTRQVTSALASAATIALSPTTGDVIPHTPTQSETINGPGTPLAGQEITFVITTSGTTSYTITWGSNMKSTGTLATGTTSGKVFIDRFISDGTNFNEVDRQGPM
jgi:hypothetical protein